MVYILESSRPMYSSTQESPVGSSGLSGGARPSSGLSRTLRLLLLCPEPRPGEPSAQKQSPADGAQRPGQRGSSCSPTGNRRIRVRSTAAVAPCCSCTGEDNRL